MARDPECNQRSANAEEANASPLSRFFGSDAYLFIVFLGLGTLTFGWVIYPPLGMVATILNAALASGLAVTAIVRALVAATCETVDGD